MIRFFSSVAVLAMMAGSTAAFAADFPLKAPPAAPLLLWNGFYFGGNVGYSIGRVKYTSSNVFIAGGNAGTTDSRSAERSIDGVIGGGQIGYNWQATPNWVWGFETDFQGSGQKNSSSNIGQDLNGVPPVLQTTTQATEHKLEWFGTARLRAGYVVGNTLWYGTGGYAYGKVEVAESTNRVPGVAGSASFAGAGSVSSTRSGWTAGGGVETKFGPNWSAKLEYLFIDLGKETNAFNVLFTSGAVNGTVLSNFTSTSRFQDHIVRVGLNYSFH